MVCPRCIKAIRGVLKELEISFQDIQLGQVRTINPIDNETLKKFENKANELGFELLEPGKSALISKIKTVVIEQIHYPKKTLNVNFSTYLSDKLHYEYSYLSRLFSSVEGITIEKYIALQKIEKIKELIIYNQETLSQIAEEMNYSSVAYLSAQFKKETGMTPTQFKNQSKPTRKGLDEI